MKLDPGMHIGMHLVFFGKSGVTVFSDGLPEKKLQLIGMSILINPIKHWVGMSHRLHKIHFT
jgi:hypothetical protein